ncbi:putative ABC transport integral membrane subunit [Mesorhizobium plurifarium]|nr:putative ABC transport integral membrane subunit [Mesorhizobium plurifarium]
MNGRKFLLDNVVWILIIVFSLLAGVLNPFFLSEGNLQNVLVQATTLGVLVLAVSFTLLIGEIDLSVVGNLVFSGMIGAYAMQEYGAHWTVAVAVTVLTGTLIGALNGYFVSYMRMNSLIATLAMGLFLQGAVLGATQARTLVIADEGYAYIGSATIGTWPIMPVALFVIYLAAHVVLAYSAWGRNLYATGGNRRAAHAAGINVRRARLGAFAASGFLAGLAGFLYASYLGGVSVTVGSTTLLYAVAAPVIGGVSLLGGRGRVLGMLGGTLLITVIQTGLQLINVSAYYIQMIGGAMILLAIAVDAFRVRGEEQGSV